MKRAACLLALLPFTAEAQLEPAQYLARYPALYLRVEASRNEQSRAFDANGAKRDSATPTYGNGSAFPITRETLRLEWFFPFFEAANIPLVSSRLWTAKARLGLVQTDTEGGIADFAEANDLANHGDGVSDLLLEFGPVLAGSSGWRTQQARGHSLTALARFHLPLGSRDADAPNNAGSNTLGIGLGLQGYWRPLPRLHLDLGLSADTFVRDEEPAFAGQFPAKAGNRLAADFTASTRLFGNVYLSAGADYWKQSANSYDNVRLANNPPPPDMGMDGFPDPNPVQDGGAQLSRVGAGLNWFVLPRLKLGLHWWHPVSGRSGEFNLRYLQQLQRCGATETPVTPTVCDPQPYGSAPVDGLGSARAYADDTFTLSLGWQLRQGDFFLGR